MAEFSLQQLLDEIKSEFEVKGKGVGYVSIRGAARIVGVTHTSLVRDGVFSNQKLSEKLEGFGFDAAAFVKDGIPDAALAIIVEYFAFDAGKNCTSEAKACQRAFAAIGIRKWIHSVVGYQEQSAPFVTDDHIEAYLFQRDVFKPWVEKHPNAVSLFLDFQGKTLPSSATVEQQLVLPPAEFQELMNNAFLNLNRSGLAMNKLFHFIDRIPTMQKMGAEQIQDLMESLAEAGQTIGVMQSELQRKDSVIDMLRDNFDTVQSQFEQLQSEYNKLKRSKSLPDASTAHHIGQLQAKVKQLESELAATKASLNISEKANQALRVENANLRRPALGSGN